MLVRAAEPSDADAVVALWAAAGSAASVTDDADSVRNLIAYDPLALLVAEIDGAVVGSIIAGWDGWRGSIYRLAVRPDARRRGIGRALAAGADARLRERGCVRISAIVISDDDRAVAFWTAMGYDRAPGQARFTKTSR